MRVANKMRGIEEIAASTAATDSDLALGTPFWTSVGTGVFTGGLVWLLHRALNHYFPMRRA